MGGNARKDAGVVRLPARLYAMLAERVVARLTDGVLFPGLQARAIPAVRAKTDFGDLDVLVMHQEPGWGFDAARRAALTAAFQPTRLVTSGPVLSFDVTVPGDEAAPEYAVFARPAEPTSPPNPRLSLVGLGGAKTSSRIARAGTRFQVDLIQVPTAVFTFALGYFSYNDLGNLLGRIARLHGFKLGHAGLFRPLRAPGNESHFVRDILVTRDWSRALQFLGYDPARWERGFDSMDEMFAFVRDSRAFHPSAFPLAHSARMFSRTTTSSEARGCGGLSTGRVSRKPLEHRSHRARVRDRKRPTYTAFLQHLAERGLVPATEIGEDRLVTMRKMGLARALDQFEVFAEEWQQAQAELRDTLLFRQRFNGDVVRRMTGLDGAALGQHMRALRAQFSSEEALRSFVLGAPDETLATFIRHGKT